jgi:dihydrolipoamide dehydrogenase
LPIDEVYVCSSTGALEQKKIPKKLIIYGGGIVGLEIGSVYQRLGSDVTVLQRSGRVG